MKTSKTRPKKYRACLSFSDSTGYTLSASLLCSLLAGSNALAQAQGPPPGGDRPAANAPPSTATSFSLQPPSLPKNEISVSGDYLFGQGEVSMPFFHSLAHDPVVGPSMVPDVASPPRQSDYIGATLSYSHGQAQAWYLDLSYAQGSSSGDVPVEFTGLTVPTKFQIDDNWYQAYIRYTFPKLRGKRLSAYIRVGVSYVQADLRDQSSTPGIYDQKDRTQDILGNLGFGITYGLYYGTRAKVGLQLEGEGFYGNRSQDSQESLPNAFITGPATSINNDLYGAIGRSTVRFQYDLGRKGLLKAFADAGISVKYTFLHYSSGLGTPNELLWGPYVKIGLRYSF